MSDAEKQYKVRLRDGMEFGPGTMGLMVQWAREGRVPKDAMVVDVVSGEVRGVLETPELLRIVHTLPTSPGGTTGNTPTSAPAMIPYHNGTAVAGYYVAVFSLIPGVGALLGPVALILGIVGYKHYLKQPEIRGKTHSWVAMIVGGLVFLLHVLAIIAIVVGSY